MNGKKIVLGVVGALATAAGAIMTLVSEVMPNEEEKKEEDEETQA